MFPLTVLEHSGSDSASTTGCLCALRQVSCPLCALVSTVKTGMAGAPTPEECWEDEGNDYMFRIVAGTQEMLWKCLVNKILTLRDSG